MIYPYPLPPPMPSPAFPAEVIPMLWSEDWWSEFLRSPGFGGSVAVLAAAIGLAAVLLRGWIEKGQAEKAREHERTAASAGHWWEMYRWSLSQLDVMDYSRAATLFEALDVQAPTEAERALVSIGIDLLRGNGVEGGEGNGSDQT